MLILYNPSLLARLFYSHFFILCQFIYYYFINIFVLLSSFLVRKHDSHLNYYSEVEYSQQKIGIGTFKKRSCTFIYCFSFCLASYKLLFHNYCYFYIILPSFRHFLHKNYSYSYHKNNVQLYIYIYIK